MVQCGERSACTVSKIELAANGEDNRAELDGAARSKLLGHKSIKDR